MTSVLGKFQNDPGNLQCKMCQNFVRYLRGTDDYEIFLPGKNNGQVVFEACSDSDWARDKQKRRSRTGFIRTVKGGTIFWSSELQRATSQSSTEAEFSALQSIVREIRRSQNMLAKVGVNQYEPTEIQQENLGSISLTPHVQELRNVKRVKIKYHYVQYSVEKKRVSVNYTPSAQNLSDPFTKAFIGETFKRPRTAINVIRSAKHASPQCGMLRITPPFTPKWSMTSTRR